MDFIKFKKIFDETIFEKSKPDLLEKISKNPDRYIGLFRPTKPKAKILQNLLQSHEIRFGDAFEKIIEEYLLEANFTVLSKTYKHHDDNLKLDHCFKDDKNIYFIEQKIRDDHDSSKKRGQLDNFEKKLISLLKVYREEDLKGFFYFVDPALKKNKNYYTSEIKNISLNYNVSLEVLYGEQLFNKLNIYNFWEEIIKYLKEWKRHIQDLPEVNFDLDYEDSFNEIKNLSPQVFRKIITDKDIFENITLTLFPQKKVLKLLQNFFESKNESIYKNLAKILKEKL
jgi:hypothetical protein